MNMTKKLTLLILMLLICVSSVFSSSDPVEKYITAYKRKVQNSIPTGELQFRIIEERGDSFDIQTSGENSGDVEVPFSARGNDVQVLTWVLSGNIFGSVTLDLDFGPMYLFGDNSRAIIPYTVTETYTSSKVGNTQVSINKAPTSVGKLSVDFIKDVKYELQYADSVNVIANPSGNSSSQQAVLSKSVSVNTTSQKLRVVADMSTRTLISPSTPAFSSKFVDSNGAPLTVVCEHWNRYGSVAVNLGLTSDGKINGVAAEAGTYYANVVVSLSCTN